MAGCFLGCSLVLVLNFGLQLVVQLLDLVVLLLTPQLLAHQLLDTDAEHKEKIFFPPECRT